MGSFILYILCQPKQRLWSLLILIAHIANPIHVGLAENPLAEKYQRLLMKFFSKRHWNYPDLPHNCLYNENETYVIRADYASARESLSSCSLSSFLLCERCSFLSADVWQNVRYKTLHLGWAHGHMGTWELGTQALGTWVHGHMGTDQPLTKRPPHFKYFWPKKCDLGRSNGEGGSWWEYEGFFLPRHSVSGCQSSQPAPSWDQLTSSMKWLYHYQPPKSKYLRVWLIK